MRGIVAAVMVSCGLVACSLVTSLDGLEGSSPGNDGGGTDARVDVVLADGGEAGDGGALCGFPGESCCVAPLAPCEDGLACSGAKKCMVSDAWALGEYTALLEASYAHLLVTAHWDGAAWTQGKSVLVETTGPTSIPIQILASGSEVRAIANAGTIGKMYRWNGVSWAECKTGNACLGPSSTVPLWAMTAVTNAGTPEFWLAGTNVMYRCANGQVNCTSVTNGITGTWGTGNFGGTTVQDLWYSVFDHVLRYDGSTWSSLAAPDARTIGFLGNGDVWAGDKQLRHWNGSAWSSAYLVDGAQVAGIITSIDGASSNDVFGVGSENITPNFSFAAHWNGTAWSKTPLPANLAKVTNVYAPSPIEAFVAGRSGSGSTFAHWDGSKWNAVPSPAITYPGEISPTTVSWVSVTGRARPRR